MSRAVGALVAALAISAPAAAMDGNDLYNACSDRANNLQYGRCLGYIDAATDVHSKTQMLNNGDPKCAAWDCLLIAPAQYCLPERATMRQLVDVAMRYLQDNPAQRHDSADGLITLAMRRAFPCAPGK